MAHEHGEVLACALGHAYLCLALTFSGRHAEAAAGDVAAEAGHLLARPARHRAQSDGAVPRSAAASARAAWALTRRPIHQNSTPMTMKHSTGTPSVNR
jgi:hypothetical protein